MKLQNDLSSFDEFPAGGLYTDIFNAKAFTFLHKDHLRWCKALGGWFIFNGKYWELDGNGIIKKFAIETYEDFITRLQGYTVFNEIDEKNLENFSKHVKATGSNGKLEAMIDCSKTFLGVDADIFDANPNLFNCLNGTLDFATNKFLEFKPEDYLTKISNVSFDPTARCPLWEAFLQEICLGREELIYFIQQAIGYCLTGHISEQCFFILYGSGRNGKSTFLEVLEYMFGCYARHCPSSTLMKKQVNHIPNDIARLKGARFVNAVESGNNCSFDEPLIKQLTGGDRITARFLNKEFFEFAPNFKIFIATNHKPNIYGTDEGIWRRVRLIPFEWQVPMEKMDKNLTEKLKAELPGILKWALEGYKNWRNKGLLLPFEIESATSEYRAEEDQIGQFIGERCLSDSSYSENTARLRQALNQYLCSNYSFKSIKKHLTDRGIKYDRIKSGIDKGKYCFVGIKLINPTLTKTEREE